MVESIRSKTVGDRLTCLTFNAEVCEVMSGESADVANVKLALALSVLKPYISDVNAGTALYDAIDAAYTVLVRNKLAGLLLDDSIENQIILITDGEGMSSTEINLQQACQRTKEICNN